jgi:hypothetical protein
MPRVLLLAAITMCLTAWLLIPRTDQIQATSDHGLDASSSPVSGHAITPEVPESVPTRDPVVLAQNVAEARTDGPTPVPTRWPDGNPFRALRRVMRDLEMVKLTPEFNQQELTATNLAFERWREARAGQRAPFMAASRAACDRMEARGDYVEFTVSDAERAEIGRALAENRELKNRHEAAIQELYRQHRGYLRSVAVRSNEAGSRYFMLEPGIDSELDLVFHELRRIDALFVSEALGGQAQPASNSGLPSPTSR